MGVHFNGFPVFDLILAEVLFFATPRDANGIFSIYPSAIEKMNLWYTTFKKT